MSPPVRRDDLGHYLPGSSGNLSGRPKGAGEIRELARQYLPSALAKIGELVGSADPRVALAASQEILNRVFGRPVQAIESDVRTVNLSRLYLEALKSASSLSGEAATINITPSADEPADQIETTDEW
jgi:hypothetical protein